MLSRFRACCRPPALINEYRRGVRRVKQGGNPEPRARVCSSDEPSRRRSRRWPSRWPPRGQLPRMPWRTASMRKALLLGASCLVALSLSEIVLAATGYGGVLPYRLRLHDLNLFGENYLQEAEEKIDWCADHAGDVARDLVWHFIGHIQSRKCRDIAGIFDWVHTVDSEKVARRLDQHRRGDPLNVLIQVNIDDEATKSGVKPSQLAPLARTVSELPNLNLRGLMIIPRAESDFDRQRSAFRRCRELQESLNREGLELDHLSMGMTADMEAAIAEGATMVRIGTAIFGPRPGS